MARCCGSTGTCACKVEAGRNIHISGIGSAGDPFVISGDFFLDVQDTQQFDLVLSGSGTQEDPYLLTVQYAATGQLKDLPDVSDTAPTNGQVLAWNTATQKWEAVGPTTASAGSVAHDTSLSGDGSSGNTLAVVTDEATFITTRAAGVGLSDAGINALIRPFADATARAAAAPAPIVGSVSMLLNDPGRIEYWDGDSWEPIRGTSRFSFGGGGELLSLSGFYPPGRTVVNYVKKIALSTDSSGVFEVLSAAELTGYAGVLSAIVQPVGTVGWHPVVRGDTNRIIGTAFRVDDGTPLAGTAITAIVTAVLY